MEGSIRWWCRGHRAHHRFTDTPKDPYSAQKGLFWSHLGWMLVKEDSKNYGKVDISDLNRDPMVMFQHRHYIPLSIFFALVLPTLVCGLGWGDWLGGYFYAGITRLVLVHHATFCVNSLAHYLGEATYDDRRTPRDHLFTALMTFGEGYHNFHHEFPSDFRNAIEFWQYDPTKWLIMLLSKFNLVTCVKMFPENEIVKGKIHMIQKKIDGIKQSLDYGPDESSLPAYSWSEFTKKVNQGKLWIILFNKVYDVTDFMDEHPGGKAFLKTSIGKDMSIAFDGGIYNHSNAARNLMSQFLVGKLSDTAPSSAQGRLE